MAYESSGSLTTDKKSGDSFGWDTQTDWEAYQSINNINIVNGALELATTTTIVDDFEDGDLSEYSVGSTGYYTTTTARSQNGSYALSGGSSSTSNEYVGSTSGLNAYPSPGDTFRFWLYSDSASDTQQRTYWATQGDGSATDEGSGYSVEHNSRDGSFNLYRHDSGGQTELDTVSYAVADDEWVEIEVRWGTDNTIEADLIEAGSVVASLGPVTDSNYTSGGIGFRYIGSTGADEIFWDYFRIV